MTQPTDRFDREPVGVLASGGLDSVVLVAQAAQEGRVRPIYVSAGLAWEADEKVALERVLQALPCRDQVGPPARLEVSMTDVYRRDHWAVRGMPPAYDTPDADVYLPGRNIVLLSKASVYCALNGIHRLLVGPLAGNPFPDATPAFFTAMARALSLGLDHEIRIEAPLLALHKADVVKLAVSLGVPAEMTLSCMNPRAGVHCGLCSKCRERRDAFREAGVADATEYAAPEPR